MSEKNRYGTPAPVDNARPQGPSDAGQSATSAQGKMRDFRSAVTAYFTQALAKRRATREQDSRG